MSTEDGGTGEGARIGPYRIVRRIGGGGMGVVHEAHDEALDRRVALKVIAPHLAESDHVRSLFTREARALAALDSPHVVPVYAHGVVGGRLYLATQLVPDGDLDRLLETQGALPVRAALDVLAQVCDGLADAHAAGLVHRDIKPANVLLRRRASGLHAYLADFGIAHEIGAAHDRSAGTIGTPSYLAPELHAGSRAGVASDVYALGCLLWATLSGRAPYGGASDDRVAAAHLEQPVPQLIGTGRLVAEVNRILRTALAKDPATRYPSAGQLGDDLRRAQHLPGPGGGVADSPRQRPLAVRLVALLLLLIGADVAYAVSRGVVDPASPAGASPTRGPAAEGLEAARASLAAALSRRGGMSTRQARCAAEHWIRGAGLQVMQRAGFFDDDWGYVDRAPSRMTPVIADAATSAALACAREARAPPRRTSPRAGRR